MTTPATLAPGANAALSTATAARFAVSTGYAHADLVVLLVDKNNKADNENGVALWSQPSCAGGNVTITGDPIGPGAGQDYANINLAALDQTIDRIIIVAQADGVDTLKDCVSVTAVLSLDGADSVTLSIPSPPAVQTMQVGELYRHNGGWKVRCLGDGYADGLAKLLTVHGIDVDDDSAAPDSTVAEPAAAAAPAPTVPVINLTKGEDKLPEAERQVLSLRKQEVAKVLLKKNVAGVKARVIVVMDASGSMSYLYSQGTVKNSVRRCAAVAAQMDDDGEMEAWRFANTSSQVPTMNLADMPAWLDQCVGMDSDVANGPTSAIQSGGLFGRKRTTVVTPGSGLTPVGYGNEEQYVIADIRKFVAENPTNDPTFVLFFSDGGVYNDGPIEKELLDAQLEPIFWQFIGLGSANGYGVLERFDTLPGRDVDNVGFCAIDGIDEMTDPDLYALILNEFPEWFQVAKARGITG